MADNLSVRHTYFTLHRLSLSSVGGGVMQALFPCSLGSRLSRNPSLSADPPEGGESATSLPWLGSTGAVSASL